MMQKFCRSYFPLNSLFLLPLDDAEILNALTWLENDTRHAETQQILFQLNSPRYIQQNKGCRSSAS